MQLPTDLKDTKALRDFFAMVHQQSCSLADLLDEPWKGHFNALKTQYDDALKALPPTDAVPAALDANRSLSSFFSCLCSANALCSMMGTALNSMIKEKPALVQTALNSALPAEITRRITAGELFDKAGVEAAVAAAISTRTQAGELVPKDTVTQLCSAARTQGLTEGETKVRGEVQAATVRTAKITERKTALQTAGLPVPEAAFEGMLAGTDEEFNAAKTTAETRIGALQSKGIALNAQSPLRSKVWLPEAEWKTVEALMVETLAGADSLRAPAKTPAGGAPATPFLC